MTGFGRGEAGVDTVVVTAEARSVNHRHLDVVLRLPRTLAGFELEARRRVQARLERGRVEVTFQVAPAAGTSTVHVSVDDALARDYLAQARMLAAGLGLSGDIPLVWVLERPGVVRIEDAESAGVDVGWPALAEALDRALDDLVGRRAGEGELLAADLRLRHSELAATVDDITRRAPAAAARREARLRERIKTLLGDVAVDEHRLVTEVAIWADKTDLTEELTRLRAHLAEFVLLLGKGGAIGRQMDFLIQELNREVNTVASKADDLELSQATLAAKGILEKIREQVQNLE
jgi:uncharacterized protein (TIGR00255 family)